MDPSRGGAKVSGPTIDPEALDRLKEWGGEKLLSQMIRLFLESTPERVRQITEGLERGEIELVERGSHSLKSSAANLGAERLRELSAEVEDLAHRGELLGVEALLTPLVDAHREACDVLGAMGGDGP
jgi:two-component system, sensor histidine kinase and response regulator